MKILRHFVQLVSPGLSVVGTMMVVGMVACQGDGTHPRIYLPNPEDVMDGTAEDAAQSNVDENSDITILEDAPDAVDSNQADDDAPLDMMPQEEDVQDVVPEVDIEIDLDMNRADLNVSDGVDGEDVVDVGADVQFPCEDADCEITTPIIQITAGDDHTCALREDGTVLCVGSNWWGALGDGNDQSSSAAPVSPVGLPPVYQIAAGGNFTCARGSDHLAWCWGSNDSGKIGNGEFTWAQQSPGLVVELTNVGWIAAGSVATGALDQDGTAYMWGRNATGQLGDNTIDNSATPKKVVTDAVFSDLEIGSSFTCGVTKQGSVYCWGSNSHGELGNGGVNIEGIHTPVPVVGLEDVVRISSGGDHSCVLRKTGTVKCWGQGKWGQLGDGTFLNSYTPGTVTDLEDVNDVAVGANHSCAVLNNGSVWCWGKNDSGRLGDGTTQSSAIPIRAKGVEDAIQVTCGLAHTCALRKNGKVMCWGSNKDGQLGTGTKESSLVPIPAAALN